MREHPLTLIPTRWAVVATVMGLAVVMMVGADLVAQSLAVQWCATGCGPGHVDYVSQGQCGCQPSCDAPDLGGMARAGF